MEKTANSSLKLKYVSLICNFFNFLGNKMSKQLQMGKYQHYKGNFYQVEGIAFHSETEEEMVIYRPLYGQGDLWVRPLAMFVENVEIEGKSQPRFAYIGSK